MFSRFASLSMRGKVFAGAAAVGTLTLVSMNLPGQGRKEKIVIIGGGTAGIGIAAILRNEDMKNVPFIEPSVLHYYQPLWTLVGGGVKDVKDSAKPMSDVMPRGTRGSRKEFSPLHPAKIK
jgi:hypothetical protein